jgi:hypothetical protein
MSRNLMASHDSDSGRLLVYAAYGPTDEADRLILDITEPWLREMPGIQFGHRIMDAVRVAEELAYVAGQREMARQVHDAMRRMLAEEPKR